MVWFYICNGSIMVIIFSELLKIVRLLDSYKIEPIQTIDTPKNYSLIYFK